MTLRAAIGGASWARASEHAVEGACGVGVAHIAVRETSRPRLAAEWRIPHVPRATATLAQDTLRPRQLFVFCHRRNSRPASTASPHQENIFVWKTTAGRVPVVTA